MSDEWGPWIDHDGKGCPLKAGTTVMVQDHLGGVYVWVTRGSGISWSITEVTPIKTWYGFHYAYPIVRYRLKKPKALLELINMVERMDA